VKTFSAKPHEVEREWYVVDATDRPLGRLATEVATVLRGKHKPIYTPHVDTGDHVIVINCDRVRLTGNKINEKVKYHHSGYVGNLREVPYSKLMAERPEYVVSEAIRGMLPKNTLGREMLKKLRVYRGAEHPHIAQKPKPLGGK
jgi:large subunit ribosomal protein L13